MTQKLAEDLTALEKTEARLKVTQAALQVAQEAKQKAYAAYEKALGEDLLSRYKGKMTQEIFNLVAVQAFNHTEAYKLLNDYSSSLHPNLSYGGFWSFEEDHSKVVPCIKLYLHRGQKVTGIRTGIRKYMKFMTAYTGLDWNKVDILEYTCSEWEHYDMMYNYETDQARVRSTRFGENILFEGDLNKALEYVAKNLWGTDYDE